MWEFDIISYLIGIAVGVLLIYLGQWIAHNMFE